MAAARKKSSFVYSDAADELETILNEIETGSADVDVLSERVERAAELIRGCREALAGTEMRVRKVVEELSTDDSEARSNASDDQDEDDDESRADHA